MLQFPLSFTVGNLCVQFDTEAVSHYNVSWFLHVIVSCGLYLFLGLHGQMKYWESKERDYYKEILMMQNRLLQKDLDAIKISAAYIHQVCSTIRSCYLWHSRGSCECKLLAYPSSSRRNFKVVLIRIIKCSLLNAFAHPVLCSWLENSCPQPLSHWHLNLRTADILAKLLILHRYIVSYVQGKVW
jgi:hypothetical protein